MQTCIYTWLTIQINTAKNSVHVNTNMVWPYAGLLPSWPGQKSISEEYTYNVDPSSNWPQTLYLSRNQPWILSLPRAPLQSLVQTSSSRYTHAASLKHTTIPQYMALRHSDHSVIGPWILLSPVASLQDTHANEPPDQTPDLTVPPVPSLDLLDSHIAKLKTLWSH